MPITPQFNITQTDTHVNLEIRVPHVRVTSESVQVAITDDSVLHFASPPYLLLLEFAPHQFHETADESCATYEPTIRNGVINLLLKKKKKGQWENLDLLGRMVPSKKPGTSRWLKEVKGDDYPGNEEVIQEVDDSHESTSPMNYAGYGFLRMFHGIFTDLARDGLAKEMLEMPWEEKGVSVSESSIRQERREQRSQMEEEKFNADRYMGDLEIEDDYIFQCAMATEQHWQQSLSDSKVAELTQQLSSLEIQSDSLDGQESYFSSEERLQLMSIPYPILPSSLQQPDQEHALLLGLVDILFAYVYDHIVTDGDPTVESAWNITLLSPSLSWLEDWMPEDSVQTVTASSIRRALIYPYIRNYEFAVYMMTQVTAILRQGIRCVVRCLLKTRTILDRSEMFYLGNKLFLDPYLAWVQAHATTLPAKLVSLAESVEKVLLDDGLKGALAFDLVRIEATAREEGDEDSSESESEDDESDSSSDEDSSGSPDKADQSKTAQDQDGPTLTKAEDVRSSELLDSNLGKSVLAIAQPSTGTGAKILESEPTQKPLISTKTEDARSSELLDYNLGKSVLAIAQPSTATGPKILESEPPSTATGPKILESEPTKKPLIEEIE
jgi:protein SHQ1